ncbi:MAG: aspartate carbamoyltransferase catalytic subunit [Chloroflexi bacterium]|nr:aspartate carbamoyltransferase catalytic subunit [Chloroflexota bacterium]
MRSSRALLGEALREGKAPAWQRRHVLDLDDFSLQELELVLHTARAMKDVLRRDVKKVPSLRGKTVVTLFYEPSTRTRVSFETAGKIMSADVINVTNSGSSIEKGESLLDTLLTVQAMAMDIIVLRHPHSGAPYFAARNLGRSSVINAGDGTHAHPTQALLDVFTLQEHLGSLDGKRVVIVGDISHSRVARSDLWALTRLGARLVLCGPPTLMPWDLLKGRRDTPGHPFASVEVETDLDKAIEGAEVIIALRLQKERQGAGLLPSLREYARLWQVDPERLARASPNVRVMHPGPMNEGVEISPEVAHSAQALVQEQVTNGLAVRMALLYLLCGPRELGA